MITFVNRMLEISNGEAIAPCLPVMVLPALTRIFHNSAGRRAVSIFDARLGRSLALPGRGMVRRLILASLLVVLAGGVQEIRAADVLWTGPDIEFTQSATNMTDVLIPGEVSLTRDYSQWLFNPDAGDTGPATGTPSDTTWAFGLITNYLALDYQTFDTYRNGDLSSLLVSNAMVVHLTSEDIYLSLMFTAWPQHGGFFAYTRSTPGRETMMNSVVTNGLFAFDYTASAGLSYVVQRSTNLVSWVSVATNVPASSPAHFTDNFAAGGPRYYRVGRQPIPPGAQ
jgi:hypothetical protein